MVAKEDTTSRNYANLRFNGDTGTNYSRTYIFGNGTTAESGRTTSAAQIRWDINGLYDTLPSMMTADIFSYAGSTNKTCLLTCAEDYNGAGNIDAQVGLWRNTAAITSITIVNLASNLAIGTTATLYGIKAA
jgi:hypothetical protein